MKIKLFTILAFLGYALLVSSCSFKMKAKNLPVGLPDYTAYNNGDTVFKDGSVKKALEPIKVEKKEVSEVKEGQSFTVTYNEKEYKGIYYGKLNMFQEFGGFKSYGSQSNLGPYDISKRGATFNYYLQKRGENEVYDFSLGQLKSMIYDQPLAYRKASAASIYRTVGFSSIVMFIGGLTAGVFMGEESTLKSALINVGLISFPIGFTSIIISNKKAKKAIEIYNR